MAEPSVQKILFNSDGTQVAFICSYQFLCASSCFADDCGVVVTTGADRTLRIWDNKPSAAAEVARLSHNSQIASACWLEGAPAVMTMCMDGSLSTWTRGMVSVLFLGFD
jgi:WD40 repeat protein